MRGAILLGAVAMAALGSGAGPGARARPRLTVRLEPAVVTAGPSAGVEVFLVNAGAATWTYHFAGGGDGCVRPFHLRVVDRRARASRRSRPARPAPAPTRSSRRTTTRSPRRVAVRRDLSLAARYRGRRLVALGPGVYTVAIDDLARAPFTIRRAAAAAEERR